MPAIHYSTLYCHCGHSSTVGTTRWLHRHEILRRARCTVCGRRGAKDMTAIVIGGGMMQSDEAAEAKKAAIPVYEV